MHRFFSLELLNSVLIISKAMPKSAWVVMSQCEKGRSATELGKNDSSFMPTSNFLRIYFIYIMEAPSHISRKVISKCLPEDKDNTDNIPFK